MYSDPLVYKIDESTFCPAGEPVDYEVSKLFLYLKNTEWNWQSEEYFYRK